MKNMLLSLLALGTMVSPALFSGNVQATEGSRTVLATTFPVYQLVRHVTEGRQGLRTDLMIPSQLGCPHDYALTPQDMKKLATADILVVNGLGMEEFLGAPVEKANPKIVVIDSSADVSGTMKYTELHDEEEHEAHEEGQHHEDAAQHEHAEAAAAHDHDHEDEQGHHHHHEGINPHLFASPRMAARLTLNIAARLSALDPEGAALYTSNAQAYATLLNTLADEFAARTKALKNTRIVQPHGVFDYLARDAGLTVVAVTQPHGQEPSAAEMKELVAHIREEKAGAIFTEPQYPAKVGETLAKETGVPVSVLDPVASGPENAPLDYYETTMRQNLQTLERILGVK